MKNLRAKRIACILTALALLVALGAAYIAYGISHHPDARANPVQL